MRETEREGESGDPRPRERERVESVDYLENLTRRNSREKGKEKKRVNKKRGPERMGTRNEQWRERDLGIGNWQKKNYGATVGDGLASLGNRAFWVRKDWG